VSISNLKILERGTFKGIEKYFLLIQSIARNYTISKKKNASLFFTIISIYNPNYFNLKSSYEELTQKQ